MKKNNKPKKIGIEIGVDYGKYILGIFILFLISIPFIYLQIRNADIAETKEKLQGCLEYRPLYIVCDSNNTECLKLEKTLSGLENIFWINCVDKRNALTCNKYNIPAYLIEIEGVAASIHEGDIKLKDLIKKMGCLE